jgi:hypothetical protein
MGSITPTELSTRMENGEEDLLATEVGTHD